MHPPTSAPERNPNLPPQRESSPQTDTSPLPQRDTSLLLQTDQSYSPPQKARKINSSHRIGLSQKEASKATAKKKLSASISSPIKGKEKQEVKKAKAASVAEHFRNMALVPQTGNPRGPPSDFERTASKRSVLQASKVQYHADVESRARAKFLEDNSLTKEDLEKLEEGSGIAPLSLLWKFRLGYNLVELEQVPLLTTRMRQLHQWYKSQKGAMFGARYKQEHFHKGEGILWVKFEYLYEFYQKSSVDVHILALWCL